MTFLQRERERERERRRKKERERKREYGECHHYCRADISEFIRLSCNGKRMHGQMKHKKCVINGSVFIGTNLLKKIYKKDLSSATFSKFSNIQSFGVDIDMFTTGLYVDVLLQDCANNVRNIQ